VHPVLPVPTRPSAGAHRDAWRSPQPVLAAQAADRVTDLAGDRRPARLPPRPRPPEDAPALAVPGHDGGGPDEADGVSPAAPRPPQEDPEDAVTGAEPCGLADACLSGRDLDALDPELNESLCVAGLPAVHQRRRQAPVRVPPPRTRVPGSGASSTPSASGGCTRSTSSIRRRGKSRPVRFRRPEASGALD